MKITVVIIFGLVAFAIPCYCFYSMWSWAMSQVPLSSEWAGLIKIVVSVVLFLAGGSLTITLAILGGLGAAKVAAHLVD